MCLNSKRYIEVLSLPIIPLICLFTGISEVIHQPQSFNNPMTSRILLKIIIAKIQNEKENIYRRDEEHDKYMSEAFNKSR